METHDTHISVKTYRLLSPDTITLIILLIPVIGVVPISIAVIPLSIVPRCLLAITWCLLDLLLLAITYTEPDTETLGIFK